MKLELPPETLKSIAEEVNIGMKCFYVIETKEIVCYPNNDDYDFDPEPWKDELKKLPRSKKKYIEFTAMDSRDSFEVMEDFIQEIEDADTRKEFENILHLPRPFGMFKETLKDYPELRQQWFTYQQKRNIDYIEEQLELFNMQLMDD